MQTQVQKDTIPLYRRVATILQNKIVSGQYEPGERLPTEDEMVDFYGVSKITIRNAMAILQSDGLIIRQRARGTFVADHVPQTQKIIHTDLKEMLAAISDSQIKPLSIEVLPVSECRIPKDICSFFNMINADKIGRIQRLVSREGITSFFESYLIEDIAKHITLKELSQKKSIQKILQEKTDMKVSKAEMYLQAVTADEDISTLLQGEVFEPLIHIQVCLWDGSGQPYEIVNYYCRSMNFKYKIPVNVP